MQQAEFINSRHLLLIHTRGNFLHQILRKNFAQRAADRIAAFHANQLLHAGIPGFDAAFQVHGQHADIQGFHDIFAEVFQARDFHSFLFQRRIQLRVVQRDGHVAGDGLHQLHVFAGKKIPVHRFAQPENGNGVFANAARNEIVQVELFEGAPQGIADVASGARRLKE